MTTFHWTHVEYSYLELFEVNLDLLEWVGEVPLLHEDRRSTDPLQQLRAVRLKTEQREKLVYEFILTKECVFYLSDYRWRDSVRTQKIVGLTNSNVISHKFLKRRKAANKGPKWDWLSEKNSDNIVSHFPAQTLKAVLQIWLLPDENYFSGFKKIKNILIWKELDK